MLHTGTAGRALHLVEGLQGAVGNLSCQLALARCCMGHLMGPVTSHYLHDKVCEGLQHGIRPPVLAACVE